MLRLVSCVPNKKLSHQSSNPASLIAQKDNQRSVFSISERLKAVVLSQDIYDFVATRLEGKKGSVKIGGFTLSRTEVNKDMESIGVEFDGNDGATYFLTMKTINLVKGSPDEGKEGLVIVASRARGNEHDKIYYANDMPSGYVMPALSEAFEKPLGEIRNLMPANIEQGF